MGLTLVSVKDVQIGLQKQFFWMKISRKGGHECEKACIETPIKTRFTSKTIMFKKTLEFKQAILLCYKR